MRRLRFLTFALISFVAALLGALLSPSTWLHKSLAVALCGILSANPALCTNNAIIAQSQEASATNPVKVETPQSHNLLTQRSRDFDDDAPKSPPRLNPNNSRPSSFPTEVSPNTPVRRPDFDDDSFISKQTNIPSGVWLYTIYNSPFANEIIFQSPLKVTQDRSNEISASICNQDCGELYLLPSYSPKVISTSSSEVTYKNIIIETISNEDTTAFWGRVRHRLGGKEIFFNIKKLVDRNNKANVKELKQKKVDLKLDDPLSETNQKQLLISNCINIPQVVKSTADALKPLINNQQAQAEQFIKTNGGEIIGQTVKYVQKVDYTKVASVIGQWTTIGFGRVNTTYLAKSKSQYSKNQVENSLHIIANALCVPNLSNTAGNIGKSLLGEVGSLVAAAALIGVTAAVAEWCINNPQGCMLLAKNPGLTAKALIEQLFGKGRSPEQVAQTPNPQPQLQSNGKNKTGSSYGDPHIVTFDGYRYSFQTVGEFTLVKSTDGSFEVQVRQSPVPGAQLSLNSAVAIRSGNSSIAIYGQSLPDSDTSTPIRVDGRPYPAQGGTLPNGTVIAQQGQGSYIIQTTSGEVVSVRKTSRNNLSYMDVNPSIPDIAGRYLGLLGNSNGNPKDDLQTRSGQVIETQSTYGQIAQTASSFIPGVGKIAGLVSKVENIVFDQLYKEFGNSWRISQVDSLFDYKSGHTTDTFTDRGFPSSYRTLAMLSPAQVQTATAACQQANVNPEQLEGCIFDVGFTGDSGFAETASQALEIVNTINQLIPNAIPLPKLPISIPGLPF